MGERSNVEYLPEILDTYRDCDLRGMLLSKTVTVTSELPNDVKAMAQDRYAKLNSMDHPKRYFSRPAGSPRHGSM